MPASDYQKSLARCIAYSATLTADDPRFNQDIEVRHEDGSLWYMRCGFWMPDPENDKYTWIITEHFGEQVFDAEEISVRLFAAGPVRDYAAAQDRLAKFDTLDSVTMETVDLDSLKEAYRNLRDHHIQETAILYARAVPAPRRSRS